MDREIYGIGTILSTAVLLAYRSASARWRLAGGRPASLAVPLLDVAQDLGGIVAGVQELLAGHEVPHHDDEGGNDLTTR